MFLGSGETTRRSGTSDREARRPGGKWKNIGATATARYPAVVTYTADLNPYAGGLAELRFVGTVNAGSASNKGMFLDDVHVVEPN